MLAALLASLTVIVAPCPIDSPTTLGCTAFSWKADYSAQTATIYVDPSVPRWARGAVSEHERAHVLSYMYLTATDRAEVRQLMGWSRWREEQFADGRAACRTPLRIRRKLWRVSAGVGERHPALCAWFAAKEAKT